MKDELDMNINKICPKTFGQNLIPYINIWYPLYRDNEIKPYELFYAYKTCEYLIWINLSV